MLKIVENEAVKEEGYTLDALAREGARRMLRGALEEEVAAYVERHAEARDGEGRRLVVRNGQARARGITCGAGTLEVRAPRVNDRRMGEEGERCRFTSRILPPYMRRSPKVAEVLPVCICGDFRMLEGLLGEERRTSRG
jgi:putative transposase